MFYIHRASCISPQETFSAVDIDVLHEAVNGKLTVIEPDYPGVAPGMLRRMSKAVRIGTGSAMRLLQNSDVPNGIIIGTANGGMEESIRFIKQIVEYNEDMLAPGSFVQSTANAIASQLAMLTKNNGYNITHVHKALAFENAMLDAVMLLTENPDACYLLGGIDEIASYNYTIEYAAGWYKKENISNRELYTAGIPGTICGEGAAMFLVSNEEKNAIAELRALATVHTEDVNVVSDTLQQLISKELLPGENIDLFLSGENGDNRYETFFSTCESLLKNEVMIARFKHMCGEYPTASAFALWLVCQLQGGDSFPSHMIKRKGKINSVKNILIYNMHQGNQHSFMLMSKP